MPALRKRAAVRAELDSLLRQADEETEDEARERLHRLAKQAAKKLAAGERLSREEHADLRKLRQRLRRTRLGEESGEGLSLVGPDPDTNPAPGVAQGPKSAISSTSHGRSGSGIDSESAARPADRRVLEGPSDSEKLRTILKLDEAAPGEKWLVEGPPDSGEVDG
jgi:hypothetical protein